ncbi:hypothetical protein [Cellulomonas sp. KRMCY2]|uniref:hypothetical protein n=1 Tax=Cellulomonas sp. KRMCY2 TaxID=1304865 RepID=UPI00045EA321|nr:hypothetical protein [Cellulomonas sp. KRMCY2]
METLLVLIGIVAVVVAIQYIKKGISHGAAKVIYKNTNSKGVDEIHTVLTFAAPSPPESVCRAVDARLALPHEVPTLVGKMHVSESRPDLLRVALGNKLGTEWSGAAAFEPDGAGGTVGTYRVTNWTTHDGVIQSSGITSRMREVREQIAEAVTSQGGTSQTHLVPVGMRK